MISVKVPATLWDGDLAEILSSGGLNHSISLCGCGQSVRLSVSSPIALIILVRVRERLLNSRAHGAALCAVMQCIESALDNLEESTDQHRSSLASYGIEAAR
jgi:hypothetical protein